MTYNSHADTTPASQKNRYGKMPFDSMFSRSIFNHLIPTQSANQQVNGNSESANATSQKGVELNFSHSFAA